MKIVAELSMYPLSDVHIPAIVEFILDLREQEGIELVSNQLATQVRGEYDAVTSAINSCMRRAMAKTQFNEQAMVMVVKYLNVDLDIGSEPSID